MPKIFLSPSTQEFNQYINGGNEEEYMNLVADAMEPYLKANGIQFVRNDPSRPTAYAIMQSNEGKYDLHVALHSNASPPDLSGKLTGTDVYYAPGSMGGKRFADIVVKNFKNIYYDPAKVKALPTTTLGEVTKTKAPAALIEIAYHDNKKDADWIKNNIQPIAKNISQSIVEYFGKPFKDIT